ncbi:MAG TPA: hypothetical protein DCQ93_03970 [Bacteroidetes bacterium]|nr:hypothetical protein [Bacteroidota bacterium]
MITEQNIIDRTGDYLCWNCATEILTVGEVARGAKKATDGSCGICGMQTKVIPNEKWTYQPPPPLPELDKEKVMVKIDIIKKIATELQGYKCENCGWKGNEHQRRAIPLTDDRHSNDYGQLVHVCPKCYMPDFILEKNSLRNFVIDGGFRDEYKQHIWMNAEIISENIIQILQ